MWGGWAVVDSGSIYLGLDTGNGLAPQQQRRRRRNGDLKEKGKEAIHDAWRVGLLGDPRFGSAAEVDFAASARGHCFCSEAPVLALS